VRRVIGHGAPAGLDVTGHLERIDFGLSQLLWHGHLDGWYPRTIMGAQEYLLYGPGVTWAVAAVRLATFTTLSSDTTVALLAAAAFVSVAPATASLARAVGLNRTGSWLAGLLALTVSSGRGGGLHGMFETGLLSQHLAYPAVIAALAQLIVVLRRPARAPAAGLIAASLFVLLTHPISLAILAFVSPMVIGALWITGQLPLSVVAVRRAAGLSALGIGIAGWWVVPFVVHRDLTGVFTYWDTPTLREDLRLLWGGDRGLQAPLARPIVGAIAVAFLAGVARRRDRLGIALAVPGPLALLAAHLIDAHSTPGSSLGHQLINRGLSVYCVLAVLPAAWLAQRLATWLGGPRDLAVIAFVACLAVLTLGRFDDLAQPLAQPSAATRAAAAVLAKSVPPSARFAVRGIVAEEHDYGIWAPARWLSRASGRNVLNAFVPEVAPGAWVSAMVDDPLTADNVDAWVDKARRLAVTHIVSSDAAASGALSHARAARQVWAQDNLVIFELSGSPGHPVGSLLDLPDAPSAQRIDARSITIDYTSSYARPIDITVGWSPKWAVTVDGQRIAKWRGPEDRIRLDLPAGSHHLRLEFRDDGADRAGQTLSVLSIILGIWLWRINNVDAPVGDPLGLSR
jgi:hypothetical protein